MSIFASAFSPEGTHLLAATGDGDLHIWRLAAGAAERAPPPPATHRLHSCAIYSLTFVPTARGLLLLSGSDEDVRGWRWEELLGGATPSPLLTLQNPRLSLRRGGLGPLSETTALAHDAASGAIYSAAGDGNAYAWDLEAERVVATFSGHENMLHGIGLRTERRQLVTGSEDGTCRLWDLRSAACTATLLAGGAAQAGGGGGKGGGAPSTAAASGGGDEARSEGGGTDWCGCLSVDDSETWLVAGWGRGFLCTFELNTLACVACLPTAAPPQAVAFRPGSTSDVISAGAEKSLYHWTVTGDLMTRAVCASPSIFTLAAKTSERDGLIVAAGGASGRLDVFCDLSHRAYSLSV